MPTIWHAASVEMGGDDRGELRVIVREMNDGVEHQQNENEFGQAGIHGASCLQRSRRGWSPNEKIALCRRKVSGTKTKGPDGAFCFELCCAGKL